MSLILEGIDIPKEGEWLEIIIKPTKEVIIDTIRYRDNALLKTEYSLVIQIPKGHGRLGDLDVLLEESLKEGAYNYVDSWQIAEQPTILEAEEVDEHNTEGD